MMKIIRSSLLPFIAASHEDPADPGSLKRVLFTLKDFPKSHILQMINWAKIEAGKSFRTHYHEDMDEVFIIIRGTAAIKIGNEKEDMQAGDAVLVPAGSAHAMKNTGNEAMEYLVAGISRGKGGKTVVI